MRAAWAWCSLSELCISLKSGKNVLGWNNWLKHPGFQWFLRPSLLKTFRLKSNLKWPQSRYFHQKPLTVKNYCLKSESPGKRTEVRELGRVRRLRHFLLFNGCIIIKMSPIHEWRLWKQWFCREASNFSGTDSSQEVAAIFSYPISVT